MTTNNEKKCALCKMREADKTNSHLIPDFLVKRLAGVDDNPDRDKEILHALYLGGIVESMVTRDVEQNILEEVFGRSLEDVLNGGNKTIVAKDYIFCSECEKSLSKFLESPYADTLVSNKKKDADIHYFFWLSIIWRIAKFRMFQLDLPTHIVESMGKRLNAYLKAKKNNEDLSHIMCNLPFDYSIIYCKDYSLYGNGGILAEYDKKEKTFLLILGDFVLYAYLSKHKRLRLAAKYGLDDIFVNTHTYGELNKEQVMKVESAVFKYVYCQVIKQVKPKYILEKRKLIYSFWDKVRENIALDLPPIPSNEFIGFVFNEIYLKKAGAGEKESLEFFTKVFCKGLQQIYGIGIHIK